MPTTENVLVNFGQPIITFPEVSKFPLEISNEVGLLSNADFSAQPASYMMILHNLQNIEVSVYLVYEGITTEAAFNVEQSNFRELPTQVVEFSATDIENGGTHTYYFSNVALDITGLYTKIIFTGKIDNVSANDDSFFVEISSADLSDSHEIPKSTLSDFNYPGASLDQLGDYYPEIYGTPGTDQDTDLIGDGLGSTRALLVAQSTRTYIVSGHAVKSIAGRTTDGGSVTLYVRIPDYSRGYGYIEGCSVVLSTTDPDGAAISTVTAPAAGFPRLYLPTVARGDRLVSDVKISDFTTNFAVDANVLTVTGSAPADGSIVNVRSGTTLPTPLEADVQYFVVNSSGSDLELSLRESGDPITLTDDGTGTHAITDLPQALGRKPTTTMHIGASEEASLALDSSFKPSNILRVFLSIDDAAKSANLDGRIAGVQMTINSHQSGYIEVDAIEGLDDSGKVEIDGTSHDYQSVTPASGGSDPRVNISGYSGSTGSTATYVTAWTTLSAADTDITADRPEGWDSGDLYKFDVQIRSTSGAHDVAFVGLRIELDMPGELELYVPCQGVDITYDAVDYDASRNPAVQIIDIYTRLLGYAESKIGDTFDDAIVDFTGWNLDPVVKELTDVQDLIDNITEQSRSFVYRDGEDKIQIGVYSLSNASSLQIDYLTHIIDGTFDVSLTDTKQIYNRIELTFGKDRATGNYRHRYFIREDSSHPYDSARQTEAANSQSSFSTINTLSMNADDMYDEDTALSFLQHLFDFNRIPRKRVKFSAPLHVDLYAGQIIGITHPLLFNTLDSYIVEKVTRNDANLQVECLSLVSGITEEVTLGILSSVTATCRPGWGASDFWDGWGGTQSLTGTNDSGLLTTFGKQRYAARMVDDSLGFPAYGGVGSGVTALTEDSEALVTQHGDRGAITLSRVTRTITAAFKAISVGAVNLKEAGFFTSSGGSDLMVRCFTNETIVIPEAGWGCYYEIVQQFDHMTGDDKVTNVARSIAAQNCTGEGSYYSPAGMKVGDSNAAEDPTDTDLTTVFGSEVAQSPTFPKTSNYEMNSLSLFPSATYSGRTYYEIGLFMGSLPWMIARIVNATGWKVPANSDVQVQIIFKLADWS